MAATFWEWTIFSQCLLDSGVLMGTCELLEKPNKILECDLQRTGNIPSLMSGNSPSSFTLQRLRQVLGTCTCRLLCLEAWQWFVLVFLEGQWFSKYTFCRTLSQLLTHWCDMHMGKANNSTMIVTLIDILTCSEDLFSSFRLINS